MKRWIAGFLVAASMVTVAACGDDGDTAAQSTTTTLTEAAAADPASAEEAPLTQADWGQVVASPDDYEGRDARRIAGRVFVVEANPDGGLALQMFTNRNLGDGNTIVYTDASVGPGDVNEGDHVIASGSVAGGLTGENSFGGEVTAPILVASSVRVVSATQAATVADPAVASRRLNVAAEQAGVRVTLKRVDRLQNGGRLVVEAHNTSGSSASLFSNTAKLVQGSRQSEPEFTELPGFDGDILPGVRQTAVLSFAQLRPGRARVVIEWFSDDFNISSQPFDLPFVAP